MKAVFVVGTGRSGTHFTIRSLLGFENATDPLGGMEDQRILFPVAKAAIHHAKLPEASAAYYRKLLDDTASVVLDQHHPNLFFIKQILEISDQVVFLYPVRPTQQIVASMLQHDGVMSWYKYARTWRQRYLAPVPFPNRFLGLETSEDIARLPPHILCAYRVLAHHKVFLEAERDYPLNVRQIDYEALVRDPEEELSRVFSSKELDLLGRFRLVESPRSQSLAKYLDILSAKQISEIDELRSKAVAQWSKEFRDGTKP